MRSNYTIPSLQGLQWLPIAKFFSLTLNGLSACGCSVLPVCSPDYSLLPKTSVPRILPYAFHSASAHAVSSLLECSFPIYNCELHPLLISSKSKSYHLLMAYYVPGTFIEVISFEPPKNPTGGGGYPI